MIQNEQEYQFSKRDAQDRDARIEQYRQQYADEGITTEQIEYLVAPMISYNLGIHEEVAEYESKNQRDT